MCYNILADTYAQHFAPKLYRDVPRRCLEWSARRSLLLAEIRHWAPDVVCLQEVQHWRELEQEMQAAGYEGRFLRRTGRRRDGCATFWRADRLRARALTRLEFAPLGLDDNVALLLSLEPRADAPPPGSGAGAGGCSSSTGTGSALDRRAAEALSRVRLLVATTHITFDPAKGDVKLGQPSSRREPLQTLVVVTGDFNSTAGSPIYQFVARGSLDLSATTRKKLSGQLHGVCHTQYKPISEVQQLHAQQLAAAAAASAAASAAAAAAPPVTVTATASSPPPTPMAAAGAAPTSPRGADDIAAAAVAAAVAVGEGAAAAAAQLSRQLSSRLSAGSTGSGGGGSKGGGGPLDAPLAAFQRAISERWSDRELRTAMGEQYALALGGGLAAVAPPPAAGVHLPPRGSLPVLAECAAASAAELAAVAMTSAGMTSATSAAAATVTAAAAGRPLGRHHSVPAASLSSRISAECAAAAAAAVASDAAQALLQPPLPPAGSSLAQGGGGDGSLVIRHPLQLRSSYLEVAAAEPAFTSIHSGFAGTVDFIWYTGEALLEQQQGCEARSSALAAAHAGGCGAAGGCTASARCPGAEGAGPVVGADAASEGADALAVAGAAGAAGAEAAEAEAEAEAPPRFELVPVAVLQPPPLDSLPRGLPAVGWGSDHISIVTQFELRPIGRPE
ncbi:hypothetical protein GPECTOR_23g117 [Gonium pectorale]|uniref:Endonuclease/exonuclease/phosphatase domain-containing protein n=1 Tax=Gonium pectorale TaxID=33097 RepID=A0A150GGX2_GONPE|nr:hypothetical protein GPECTOR_23g117 [Gonium pectorale]|eukprot:KXZ49029.1 hypothetical protein GPECTOR_23g117 [Gonium pectorale]